jgi:hypothetical protein
MTVPRPDIDAIYRDSLGTKEVTSAQQAMRYFAWALIFLCIAPPVTVMLWRIALMPWGAQ